MNQDTQEFKDAMEKWIELKKNLKEVRKDVNILNKEEKKLREYIKSFMVHKEIQVCNVQEQKAKVTMNVRNVKPSFTRDLVRRGLMIYFRNDDSLVQRVFDIIDSVEDVTQTETLTLRVS